MTQLDETPPPAPAKPAAPALATAAAHEAVQNHQSNLEALSLTQPHLAHARPLPKDLEWVYARDGALSARLGGEWWSGCSVPAQTARVFLRSLHLTGTACYLRPAHAAEIAVVLEMLPSNQAVVAVVPDPQWFHLALHGHDFSEAIRGNRLWFAVGAKWAEELAKIFDDRPALPIPTQLIRTPALDPQEVESMVQAVQRALAGVAPKREALLKTLQDRPRRSASSSVKRLCIVAPSIFRLWDDAGATLAEVLRQPSTSSEPIDCRTLDVDDPCSSGPLAVTLSARYCDALVVANQARDHLGQFVPPMVSVISWITNGAIPRFDPTAPRDALLLADPQWVRTAREAGWPEHRLAVAQWPVPQQSDRMTATPRALAIIADTVDASSPVPALDLSSHRLLWDLIHRELLDDPFALAGHPGGYLADRIKRLGIADENLDRRRFIEQLILPAYQQGLARLFLREGLPLRLHGHGWDRIGEFARHARGPLPSRAELDVAASDTVVVHAWPWEAAHAVESMSSPVLRPPNSRQTCLNVARRLLGGMSPPLTPRNPLTAQKILTLL